MAFPPNAAKLAAYRSTSVHSGLEASDPHRLIVVMMDGALERLATALGLMSHEPSADPQRFSEQTMVRPSVANGAAFGTRLL